MTPEHTNEMRALVASLHEVQAEYDELRQSTPPTEMYAYQDWYQDVIKREISLLEQEDRITGRIYQIRRLYEGV